MDYPDIAFRFTVIGGEIMVRASNIREITAMAGADEPRDPDKRDDRTGMVLRLYDPVLSVNDNGELVETDLLRVSETMDHLMSCQQQRLPMPEPVKVADMDPLIDAAPPWDDEEEEL